MNFQSKELDSQISYKRRCLFGFIALIIGLFLLEVTASIVEHLSVEKRETHRRYLRPALLAETNADALTPQLNNLKSLKKSTKRIVCMGDSVTFGFRMPHEKTYPAYLQRFLKKFGYSVVVVNAGQVGASLLQGMKTYLERIRDIHPDLIIISYGINDHFYNPTPDAECITLPNDSTLSIQKLLNKSALYRQMKKILKPSHVSGPCRSVRVSQKEFRFYLKKFIRWLKKDHVELILMDELSANFDLVLKEYSDIMGDVAAAKGIHMIDLYKEFPRYCKNSVVFFDDKLMLNQADAIREIDPLKITNQSLSEFFIDAYHPNGKGYKIIARIVARKIDSLWKSK